MKFQYIQGLEFQLSNSSIFQVFQDAYEPCVMSRTPSGKRLPAQVADHLSDAADVVPTVVGVSSCSALDHVQLINIFLGVWLPYRISINPNVV